MTKYHVIGSIDFFNHDGKTISVLKVDDNFWCSINSYFIIKNDYIMIYNENNEFCLGFHKNDPIYNILIKQAILENII